MIPEEKPCSARLQIGSTTGEAVDSFAVNDPVAEPVEARLGIAIGKSLTGLRSAMKFDAQTVLRHASVWVQSLSSIGSRALAEEAENSATQR